MKAIKISLIAVSITLLFSMTAYAQINVPITESVATNIREITIGRQPISVEETTPSYLKGGNAREKAVQIQTLR